MRNLRAATLAVCLGMVCVAAAQSAQKEQQRSYLDTRLTAEERATDLIHRLTLDEKVSQLVNQARAIPRLNIPSYDWWSESLHGVAVNGTTEFPEPIGLGATFDPASIHEMAVAVSTEGRIKHVQAVRAGHSDIFEGLDFWAPNINIFRDPRWGRGQETYGEDPFLTARMGVSFVKGMQGDDPRYYRAIATPKHFAVHSGPEPTRHVANVDVTQHDEVDTYLPAFRAAVTEGKAASVMCAYNSINGEPACANEFLLQDQLRGKWAFKGYVVSDCEAVRNIFSGHHYKATQAEASAISLQRGMDNECIDFFTKIKDDHDYAPYAEAVKKGYLKESEIDTALVRLFTARMRLGLFDPQDMVPYNKIDEAMLDSSQHRALARKLANESMVLLKNDGVLPLKSSDKKIAVFGPLADQTKVLLGNYNGTPTHTVSALEGLKAEFPSASIHYYEGTSFLSKVAVPAPASLLTTDGKPGVRTSYVIMDESSLLGSAPPPAPLASRIEPGIGDPGAPLPAAIEGKTSVIISSEATLTAPESGEYNLGVRGDGFVRVKLDDKVVTMSFMSTGIENKLGRVSLQKGKTYKLSVQYPVPKGKIPAPQLVWNKLNLNPSPAAIAGAKDADVLVAVVGITSELEGEEMPVSEEGFKGGDRTSLDLPKPEQALLEALSATGKPLVVVLMNGSALSVNWAKEHANAIVDAWYSGEEGGAAIAETLSGKNNPGGRLPVTFYTGVSQLPAFEDYSMKARTYRYFDGSPLYSFGYGLSYTAFDYSGLKLPKESLKAGDPLHAQVTVKNTGKLAGDEVVQLYLKFPPIPGAPRIALRGFKRIHLEPGMSQDVEFDLQPRDLSIVTDAGEPEIPEGQVGVFAGGGQPGTGAPFVRGTFEIKGSQTLPE